MNVIEKRTGTNGWNPDVAESPAREQCAAGKPAHNHFVQFYETDQFLVDSVAAFIGAGAGSGEGVVIIATAAHREAIAQKLVAQGVDVAGLESRGHYLALDSADVLSKFMVDGCPDPLKFERVIGEVIDRARTGRRGVRAFGEMVALLWADGNHSAAIRLEELWNELGHKNKFALFCAYPLFGFNEAAHGEDFTKICHCHSRVEPAEELATAPSDGDRMRLIAQLQQRALSLQNEVARREEAEKALRRRDAELTAFVENASLGLHWVGPDGIIQWANKAEFEMLGYTAEEYVGRHIAEFHADQPVIKDILDRLTRGERLRDYEARLKCKDGTIKTVLVDSCVLWQDGKFVHTQCFTREITKQKHAEEKLRESEQRYRQLVALMPTAVYTCDAEGRITFYNRRAAELWGREPGLSDSDRFCACYKVFRPDGTFVAPDETPMAVAVREGKSFRNVEAIVERPDGTRFVASVSIDPLCDDKGNLHGAINVFQDITERVRAREVLEQTVAERTASLREAVTQMEEFSYSVSHDLRAPLRAMSAYAGVLLEDYGANLDEIGRGYLEKIQRSSDRMNRLTQDVLNYSRVARAQIQLEPVALEPLIHDIIHQYSYLQSPAADVEITRPLLVVFGHETSLGQCVANLLNNAAKFVRPGTKPRVHIRTERNGKNVRVWFEDNGIGIKPEHQQRIFQLFERLHPEANYEGTGIGLTIVRKAVEKMGGRVGVESDGENGTRFWIELRGLE